MPEQVDTRVSPALHPDGVKNVEGYNDETAIYVADAMSAFATAYSAIGKIHDATEYAKNNPTWTEEQRFLIVGKEAAKVQDQICRKFDAVQASLTKAINHVDSELSQPLKERAGLGNLNQEVRAHSKHLNREERGKLLNEAFAQGDTDTLQAILGAQPFLSGLSAPEHAHYLRRFHEKQNPALVARLTVMRNVMAKLDRDAPLVFAQVTKAVGAPPAKVRGIDTANERALAALKINVS
ncbi:hypothetical protein M0208_01460 [Sphingomonas sp. SUN019]|uniref:hypothetical protein n=1 Tax=Sphingomonas sp. SUN019 TaxID=2937788 RepID=UPI002164014D|nr:hypothetical protein [Sphingomonas sp. SUN019]UVO49248.1 hypothetical protein M0208_01460 [Sphingomonas sp. SUN019]